MYSSWSGAVSVGEVPGSLNKCFYVVVPAHARLHNERGGGAWCPKQAVSSRQEHQEFIQIDLLTEHLIR